MTETKIEKLTDEEREMLQNCVLPRQVQTAEKALRIIDAQSAVIERVRERLGWLLKRAQCDGFVTVSELAEEIETLAAAPDHTECVSGYVGEHGQCNDCGNMHPAAPEHTAPDTQLKVERDALVEAVERRDQGIADLRGRLAAANARVAELERLNTNIRGAWNSANNRAIEANARIAELKAELEIAWQDDPGVEAKK